MPMDVQILDQIRKIVRESGKSILQDPRKFFNLLKDYLPRNKRETFLIWKILETGFPQALLQTGVGSEVSFLQTWFQTIALKLRFSPPAMADGLVAWAYALEIPLPPEATRETITAFLPGGSLPPLNNKVILTLIDLVRKYGQTVCFAQNWLEARLKKSFPHQPGENFLIAFLLERRVPQELAKESRGRPIEVVLSTIESRLSPEAPIDPGALRWGIEGWAQALGLEIPRDSPSLPPQRAFRTVTTEVPAHKLPPPKPDLPAPRAPAPKPAEPEPPAEKPMLRPAFVYLLILTSCGLLINFADSKRREALRKEGWTPTLYMPRGGGTLGEEPADGEEATASWPESLMQLDPPAAYRVGKMYFTGEDGPADKAQARRYFRLAAEQGGLRPARIYLAYMFAVGEGGDPDSELATRMIGELTENLTLAEAQQLLGLFRQGAGEGNARATKMVGSIDAKLTALFPTLTRSLGEVPVSAPEPHPLTLPTLAPPAPPVSSTGFDRPPASESPTAPSDPGGSEPLSPAPGDLLHQAIRSQDVDSVRTILEADPATLEAPDASGSRPLHLAVSGGNPDLVKILLEAGAQAGSTDPEGLTPLHYAAFLGQDQIVRLLVDHRAPVNSRGTQGWTPLHEAAFAGKLEVCKTLISFGADPDLENAAGNKPLHLAYYQKRQDCANFLRPLTRTLGVAAPPARSPAPRPAPVSPDP